MNIVLAIFCRGSDRAFTYPWFIRGFTRSRWAHVCVSDGEVVLNPTREGIRYFSLAEFDHHNAEWFTFVTPRNPDLKGIGERLHDWRLSPIRTSLHYLTRGFFPSLDCVTITASALRAAGLAVPDGIVSPEDLYEWAKFVAPFSARSSAFHVGGDCQTV